jgi:hypothetical protein
MSIAIHATTETPLFSVDADSAEGRDGLQEATRAYALDYTTWLPFAAERYKISPHIEDYAIVCAPICPADIPNRNGIGFPLKELVKFREPPMNRQVFKAWAGCPIHLEHANDNYETAYGVVLDSNLTKVVGYGSGKIWKVMGLYAIDKNKHQDSIPQEIITGKINTYSMGAMADRFECSYCGAQITKFGGCNHINVERGLDFEPIVDWQGNKHLAFRNAYDLTPFELSIVRDPAWTTAQSNYVIESIQGPYNQFYDRAPTTDYNRIQSEGWW